MALWGWFKGVKSEIYNLLVPVVQVTASGLRLGDWFDRILDCLRKLGLTNGKGLQGAAALDGKQLSWDTMQKHSISAWRGLVFPLHPLP